MKKRLENHYDSNLPRYFWYKLGCFTRGGNVNVEVFFRRWLSARLALSLLSAVSCMWQEHRTAAALLYPRCV